MPKPLEEITKKLRAHMIEFPDDKAVDIASVFNVDVNKVYNARENLRRHKMLPRAKKKRAPKPMVFVHHEAPKEAPKESNVLPMVAELKAEIARLNTVLAYLEKKAA
jgi:hypothetical protein